MPDKLKQANSKKQKKPYHLKKSSQFYFRPNLNFFIFNTVILPSVHGEKIGLVIVPTAC